MGQETTEVLLELSLWPGSRLWIGASSSLVNTWVLNVVKMQTRTENYADHKVILSALRYAVIIYKL